MSEKIAHQDRSALSETNLQRAFINFLARPDFEQLAKEVPRSVVERLLKDLPDKPKIVDRAEALEMVSKQFLPNRAQSAHDHGETVLLEEYLVFLVAKHDSQSIELDADEGATNVAFYPDESIHCLRDEVRTKRFTEAIGTSIDRLMSEKSNGDIRVCDAGGGAIPILAIAAALRSARVKCTCLEIDPQSARIAKAVVAALGLESQIGVVVTDGREYRSDKPFDLIVSETMDTGLLNEQIVSILNNLKASGHATTTYIPSEIETLATLVPSSSIDDAKFFTLINADVTPVLSDLPWVTSSKYVPGQNTENISAELTAVAPGVYEVAVASIVRFPNGKQLDLYDSRITSPLMLRTPRSSSEQFKLAAGQRLGISYVPGQNVSTVIPQKQL